MRHDTWRHLPASSGCSDRFFITAIFAGYCCVAPNMAPAIFLPFAMALVGPYPTPKIMSALVGPSSASTPSVSMILKNERKTLTDRRPPPSWAPLKPIKNLASTINDWRQRKLNKKLSVHDACAQTPPAVATARVVSPSPYTLTTRVLGCLVIDLFVNYMNRKTFLHTITYNYMIKT